VAFTAQFEAAAARLVLAGDCRTDDAIELVRALAAARLAAPPVVTIDAGATLGIGPTWLLHEFVAECRAAGRRVEFSGDPPRHFAYLGELAGRDAGAPAAAEPATLQRWLAVRGAALRRRVESWYESLVFGGKLLTAAGTAWRGLRRLRVPSVVRHMHETGVQAIPVVAVIALLMGRVLGLDAQELTDLGVGAMLHDMGKAELPDRVRHPDEAFSAAETRLYREHVRLGVQLGQRMGLAPGALAVVAQHHEHADGSGFPLQLAEDRLTMGARIVALVNRYDRLCNPVQPARALTPHEALSSLFAGSRQRFDARVLNAFIRMMGVYPAGSLVQLTDDRYALVVGVNSSRPLKPRVLVHDPRVARDEALLVDLERTPDLGIRRSLPPARLPAEALEYLAPRPRITYFFETRDAETALCAGAAEEACA
jgi:putative nucleotidyltransferase with HDIG domain